MVTRETKITLAFVVLGVLSWLVTREVTDDTTWPLIALVLVGIVLPQMINGYLNRERLGPEESDREG